MTRFSDILRRKREMYNQVAQEVKTAEANLMASLENLDRAKGPFLSALKPIAEDNVKHAKVALMENVKLLEELTARGWDKNILTL